MGSYSVAAGKIGAYEKTAVASTMDTITFTDDEDDIEVISDGAASLFFTVDGSDPTVGDAGSYYLPAQPSVRQVPSRKRAGTIVKVISAGTPKYSVVKANI